jgi:hypothetical protein
MVKPEQIPREVINGMYDKFGLDLTEGQYLRIIAEVINLWPGAEKEHAGVCCNPKGSIILPLPQEDNDD